MATIVRVTIEGGGVQHIEVPKGVSVVVPDYDTEGVESDLLDQDDQGDHYIESIWTPEK